MRNISRQLQELSDSSADVADELRKAGLNKAADEEEDRGRLLDAVLVSIVNEIAEATDARNIAKAISRLPKGP